MLNLDIRVLLDNYAFSAGDDLTGTIILTPPRASTSSTTTLESLTMTAKCEVRTSITDPSDRHHSSITHPYILEKGLLTAPLLLSSPETHLRFALTLPLTSQPPSTTWSSSTRFSSSCSSSSLPIPGTFADLIHHTLTITTRTSSKLFSRSCRTIPYHFLPTRIQLSPPPSPKTLRQPIRSLPSSSWRRTWDTVRNPSHASGFPTTASLSAPLPGTLVIGGPLQIYLTPDYGADDAGAATNALQLKAFELRLLARTHVRAKRTRRRAGEMDEVEEESSERVVLWSAGEPGERTSRWSGEELDATLPGEVEMGDALRLEEWMEGGLLGRSGVMPSFRTWNAALRYTLELKVLVGVGAGGKRRSELAFRRNVEVLAERYRPGLEQSGMSIDEGMMWTSQGVDNEIETDAPPAYCDPPPEYRLLAVPEVPLMLVSV